MGVLSMGYFLAFVIGVPIGALAAARLGWQWVFGCLCIGSLVMFAVALGFLPPDVPYLPTKRSRLAIADHFKKADRLSGIVAAFLTSGGIVGFLTYVGAWLNVSQNVGIERIGLIFMLAGVAAVAASPLSGWLSDHAGKRAVIVSANLILAVLFLVVARSSWGAGLIAGIAVLSVAASARQAPLHALSTELVGSELRGEYIAVRNAASQAGIATIAAISASLFDRAGFGAVAVVAAVATLLIPICCIWLKEP